MKRADFLARVRASLDREPRVENPPPGYRPPEPPKLGALRRQLCREFEAAGGFSHRVASAKQARHAIVELLRERGVRRVLRGDSAGLRQLDIEPALTTHDIDLNVARLTETTSLDQLRAAAFAADAGVTSVDFGVAETGTLALLAAPGQGRAVSLLPPLHIAVLEDRNVVHELATLFERVTTQGALPSALTFITGPSKTGDIEQKLTIGVHGPGEIHLFLIAAPV